MLDSSASLAQETTQPPRNKKHLVGGQILTPGVSLWPQTTGAGHLEKDFRVRGRADAGLAVLYLIRPGSLRSIISSEVLLPCIQENSYSYCPGKDMTVILSFHQGKTISGLYDIRGC